MIKTVIVISAIRADGTLVSWGCMNEGEAATVIATYERRGHKGIARGTEQRVITNGKLAVAA